MSAAAILARLKEQGFRLWAEGGCLQYSAPQGSVTDEILTELRLAKAELLTLLDGGHEVSSFAAFADVDTPAPLTFAQQRLWFLNDLLSEQAPELATTFNNPLALDIRGDINRTALGHALAGLADRHTLLRAQFVWNGERVYQHAGTWGSPILAEQGFRSRELAYAAAEAAISFPIQLGKEPPFRAKLFSHSDGAILLLLFHHIVSDGWSMEIFTRELIALYAEALGQGTADLPALPLDFFAYARWEAWDHEQGHLEGDLNYWRQQLAGSPQLCSLLPDRLRPASQSFRTDRVRFVLPEKQHAALKAFCRSRGVTLFTGLLTAFNILVSRYIGEEDVVVGTASACRFDAALEPIVGFFANTLVLRSHVSPTDSFATLIDEVQQVVMDAEAAQRAPFEQVVDALQPSRTFSKSPLFQIFLVLQIAEAPMMRSAGLDWQSIEIVNPLNPYDLNVHLRETPNGLEGYLQYSEQLFDRVTIETFSKHFQTLINAAVAQCDTPIGGLLLCAADQAPWDDYVPVLETGVLPRIFEECAVRYGTRTAVRCGDIAWTYAELDHQANCLASRLLAQGVGKGNVIAILLEHGVELLASLLAVLKAGAAYLPLDPAWPDSRIRKILDRAGVTHAIAGVNALPGWSGTTLRPDDPADGIPELSPDIEVTADDLAYVIYTSGSTGTPKGVAVTHGNLASHLADMVARVPVTEDDCCLALTTISFDIAALELFAPIITGGCVEIAPDEIRRDGQSLGQLINKRATIAQATPTGWSMILDSGWQRLAGLKLLVGGEALRSDLLELLTVDGDDILHLYGPTETTIWSTAIRLHRGERITIGYPIAGTFTLVLDAELKPVPAGLPGRLHIGGAGVTQGYWCEPELTARSFIDCELSPHGSRLYDTGDIVRRLPDGSLQFLGRDDGQMKLHGHRIELGEIEACLARVPGARQVAVVVHGEGAEARLVAYCEAESQPIQELQFGIFFFSGDSREVVEDPYRLILEAAIAGDRLGIGSIWTPERHFHEVGGLYPNPALLGAAIAVNTSRISIRSGSVVLPLHDPLRVAEEWSIVDNLSGGRVQLAFAAGWNVRDFILRPASYAERHAVLEHDSDTVARLWRGEPLLRATPSGPVELRIHPRPVQDELPMWITASNSLSTFELAGRLGCGILTHLLGQTVEELEVKLRSYRRALADAGWPAERARVAVMLHTFLGADASETRALARPALKEYLRGHVSLDQSRLQGTIDDETLLDELLELSVDRYLNTATLIGTVEASATLLNELASAGATEIACLLDFGLTSSAILKGMSYIPALSELPTAGESNGVDRFTEATRRDLPSYMWPASIVLIDNMPITSSSKIDRRNLAQRMPPTRNAEIQSTPPRNSDEMAVAEVWESLLKRPADSVDENFFAAGGNSLLASQMVARLRQRFERGLSLRALFERPTIAGLAASLAAASDLVPAGSSQSGATTQLSYFPLSPQQRWHWEFERELPDQQGRVYNKVRAWRIRGCSNHAAIMASADAVCARHKIFRISIIDSPTGPVCVEVPPGMPVWNELRVLRGLDPEAQARALTDIAKEDIDTRFDLATPPPLLLQLVQLADDEIAFIATFHTLLMDGWAGDIFVQQILSELSDRLAGVSDDTDPALPPEVEVDPAAQSEVEAEDAYWKVALAGLAATSLPPSDYPRGKVPDFSGDRYEFRIDASLRDRIETIARREGGTSFMVLATVLIQKLAIWMEREDVAIATLHGGRSVAGSEHVIGFVANTLILRTRCGGYGSFLDRLREMRETIIAAYSHHRLPYARAAAHAAPPPPGAMPAAQIVLVMHNQPAASAEGGIFVEELDLPTYASRYELCFALTESDGAFVGRIEYQTARFHRTTVERLCKEWLDALETWVSNPELDIGQIAGAIS